MEYLAQHIESLIFTCEQPISFKEIKAALEGTFETKFKEEELQAAITELTEHYQTDISSFEIIKIAGGYQFLTKGAFHATVGTFLKQTIKKRLSRAALETLAIVAYKQPVTKGSIEGIRGVNCDYAMQKLLEKELVTITGRSDAPGRPLFYGTSAKFMDYFGIESIQDLPKIKEFQQPDNTIGEAAPIEEEITSEHTSVRKEDDVVSIAIAIADILDPIPPLEEREEKAQAADHQAPDAGAPALDQEEVIPEEGQAEAAVEKAEVTPEEEMTNEAEAGTADETTAEPATAIDVETPEVVAEADKMAKTEVEAETELSPETSEEGSDKEGIAEFVTATTGEFTAAQIETPEEEDNHTPPTDVIIEEEGTPIQEE